MLIMMPPIWMGRRPGRQLGDAVQGLLHRHLLQQVTKCTAVSGDRMTFCTVSAWLRIGPTRASPEISELTFRNRPIRPVGGASMTTAS